MDSLQVKALCCLTWYCIYQQPFGIHVEGTQCQPGERRSYTSGCEPCPVNQYRPEQNNIKFCRNCRTCDKEKGSELLSKCSKTTDTKCRCRDGFVPSEKDPGSCKCAKGSELDKREKKCVRCQGGHFNTNAGMECKKWTDCKTRGVKIPGSHMLDVVCNDNLGDSQTSITPNPALSSVQVKETNTTSTAFPTTSPPTSTSTAFPTTSPPTSTSTQGLSSTMQPTNDRLSGYVIALLPVLLLMCLSLLFCTKMGQDCKKKFTKADTPCRKPVEESGHSCRSSLVKSCQGQP